MKLKSICIGLVLCFLSLSTVQASSTETFEFVDVGERVFHIIKPIAKGSAGTVSLVNEVSTGVLYAMKVNEVSGDAEYEREASILELLKGKSRVIQLYAKSQTPLYHKMILEVGQGVLLDEIIKSTQGSTELDVISYWLQLVSCVQQLHSANVLHLDLKPENILLVNNRLKVFDFDVSAKVSEENPYAFKTAAEGTTDYMSPEQITNYNNTGTYRVGKESDIWALGVMLYELVYNRLPLYSYSTEDEKRDCLMNKNCAIAFVKPSKVQYYPLVSIMRLCLNQDPFARPTIEELIEKNKRFTNVSNWEIQTDVQPQRISNPVYKNLIDINGRKYGKVSVQRVSSNDDPSFTKVIEIPSLEIFTLKEIDLSMLEDEEMLEPLVHDVQVRKSLPKSQFIVEYVDSAMRGTIQSVIQEYVSISLKDNLTKKTENLDIGETWRMMLLSIAAVHEQGYIHMNAIPSNFWHIKNGLKIDNFASSRKLELNETYAVSFSDSVGVPNYMPPESVTQISVNNQTAYQFSYASDVWTLGVSLYGMVYGVLPFAHYTIQEEKMKCIQNSKCKIPYPDIQDASMTNFVDVIKACLDRDAEMRPTVKSLLDNIILGTPLPVLVRKVDTHDHGHEDSPEVKKAHEHGEESNERGISKEEHGHGDKESHDHVLKEKSHVLGDRNSNVLQTKDHSAGSTKTIGNVVDYGLEYSPSNGQEYLPIGNQYKAPISKQNRLPSNYHSPNNPIALKKNAKSLSVTTAKKAQGYDSDYGLKTSRNPSLKKVSVFQENRFTSDYYYPHPLRKSTKLQRISSTKKAQDYVSDYETDYDGFDTSINTILKKTYNKNSRKDSKRESKKDATEKHFTTIEPVNLPNPENNAVDKSTGEDDGHTECNNIPCETKSLQSRAEYPIAGQNVLLMVPLLLTMYFKIIY